MLTEKAEVFVSNLQSMIDQLEEVSLDPYMPDRIYPHEAISALKNLQRDVGKMQGERAVLDLVERLKRRQERRLVSGYFGSMVEK